MEKLKYDPMAADQLPKGMELPEHEEKKRISQKDQNYSGEILAALDGIEDLNIECVHMEIVEDTGNDPVVSLVLTVNPK